jgi:di/tricarboxylate transporter
MKYLFHSTILALNPLELWEGTPDTIFHKILIGCILLGLLICLFKEWLKPSVAFMICATIIVAFNIVEPQEMLNNFANQQIATIILLMLIASALNKNFDLDGFLDNLFSGIKRPKQFLLRMMMYVAGISSLLNNTPIVAVMTPYVYNWCKKFGAHPSKLLIPLSYATILGGMMTVIGTSTNLVLNGFLTQNKLTPLGFINFFPLGISVSIAGILYLYFYGYKILPANKDAFDDVKAKAPEYLVETEVTEDSKLIGLRISESGLNGVKGAYLIELHREGEVISPVLRDEAIKVKDMLLFMGKTESIMDLVNSGVGLRFPKHDENLEIVEAVIPANSALANKEVIDVGFKRKYDAELIALHRNHEKMRSKLEHVKLLQGDLLLLSIGKGFHQNSDAEKDMYVLSRVQREIAPNAWKLKIFSVMAIGFITLAFMGYLSTFLTSFFILSLLVMLNLFTIRNIQHEIDLDLFLVLGCALTLGSAIIKTGTGQFVANNFIAIFSPLGYVGIIIGVFLLTQMLTAFVTNAAAVSIAFPFAYSISQQLGIDGTPLFVAICFAASGDFVTPFGYQTNLMVYGPGGYTPKDFFKVGMPLTIIYTTISIILILIQYGVK